MPRGNVANLQRRVGRVAGVPNKSTRALKEAIVLAAEQSVHSETKDLVGYVKYLADKKPEIFASLLGRLLVFRGKYLRGEPTPSCWRRPARRQSRE